MSALRTWLVRVLGYLTNHLVAHLPSFTLRRLWYRRLGIEIGERSGIHMGCYLWFYGPGQVARDGVRIGRHSRVNRDCTLDIRGPLWIGDNVSISPEVTILTTQHAWRKPGFDLETRPVVVEDHAWIGMRATLLPGTRVGRGAVIAAGAVAHGDIPALSVVAGVPARVVGQRPPEALHYVLDQPFPLYE